MISLARNKPKRRKYPLCVSVDHDAIALLRVLAPTSKGFGQLISELIRREAERRTERPAMLEQLKAQTAANGVQMQ
jgi:hypothetical protein